MTTDAQKQKFIQMTESPVEPLICKMAVPTIISMLITSIYNMADTFFVGRLGTSATGAVGVVFPLMALIQAVGFFFGQGSGNYISRQLGAQRREEAERMAATGFFSALCAGCLILFIGLLLRQPLVRLLGATDTIVPYALDYMCIILIGAPYMTASLVLNNQLRFQGSAAYAMVGITSGAVLNIGLDPLLIFVFDMGKPVRIIDLAKRMIQLSGAKNVEVRFTGLRAGEKLYEEVLNDEEITLPTFHPKIKIAKVREYDYDTVCQDIDELVGLGRSRDDMAIVGKMKAIVPEFKSRHSKYEVLDKALESASTDA